MPSTAACEAAGQHGTLTELKCSDPASLAEVHTLSADHSVDAARVAEILSGGKGLRVHGAWIRGRLDLDGIDCAAGLRLTGCRLDQPLTLRDATLPWLVLEECVLPAVWADRARVGTLTVRNSLVSGKYAEGTLRFASVRVTADLRLTGTRVDSPAGPAVLATGLVVDGSVFMETLDARGASPGGAVCFTGATIGDDLVLQGARLIAGAGPAFNGEILIVKGAAWLDQGFTATGTGPSGAVCLAGARVSRQLSLRGAKLANGSGPALAADLLTVRAGLMADQGFTAIGAGELAAVRLSEASIRGYLLLDGATLTNRSGPAATGAGPRATLGLRAASIGGLLSLDAGTITSGRPGEPAGQAGDYEGAVQLAGATVGGDLLVRGTMLTAFAGPALRADHLTVHGDAFGCQGRNEGFRATGTGNQGTVVLVAAAVGGQLSLSGAVMTNGSGPALVADSASVRGGVRLDEGFTATGSGGQRAVVSLAGTHVGGQLSCTGRAAPRPVRPPSGASCSPRAPMPRPAACSPGSAGPCAWHGRRTRRQPTRCPSLAWPRPRPGRRRRSSLLKCTYSAWCCTPSGTAAGRWGRSWSGRPAGRSRSWASRTRSAGSCAPPRRSAPRNYGGGRT